MSFFENTRKPVGLGGKLMVAMMNLDHSPVARWGLRFLRLAPNAKVLDCGCGADRANFCGVRGRAASAPPAPKAIPQRRGGQGPPL